MKFTYWGVELDGFDDPYNTTIINERAVEIAIATHTMKAPAGADAARSLEVGNVLSHYGPTWWRIVDLTEVADGVENSDVFDIEGRFDWIVSISTVEHVQFDHPPRDDHASQRAIEHLISLLAPGGRMLITVPTGWNTTLDQFLRTGAGATRACTLIRDGDTWRQTDEPTFLPYRLTTPWAEAVWIGEYEHTGGDR